MSKLIYGCVLSVLLLLGGCGGGSSSGGGETNDVTESAADATPDTGGGGGDDSGSDIAGTYVGNGTATASGGGFSETVTGPIQITISNDNKVAFGEPGEPPVGTTTLNAGGDGFSMSVPASFFNQSGIECTGTLNVIGTVSGNSITGNISGSGVACNGIPFTITGSFDLEKTKARSRSRGSAGLLEVLRSIIAGMTR